jgi:hypothetical protein
MEDIYPGLQVRVVQKLFRSPPMLVVHMQANRPELHHTLLKYAGLKSFCAVLCCVVSNLVEMSSVAL